MRTVSDMLRYYASKQFTFHLASLLLLVGCSGMLFETDAAKLSKWCNSLPDNASDLRCDSFSGVFIIPYSGCSGCIDEATDLAVQLVERRPNLAIVVTGLLSSKMLPIQFKGLMDIGKCFVVDQSALFRIKSDLRLLYPYFVDFSDVHNPAIWFEFSPGSNALEIVGSQLTE